MVTKLYLRATTAAEPKPNVKQSPTSITQWVASTLGGGQDGGSTIYPLDMKTAAGSDATQKISQSITEIGAAHYAWFKAWISPKLQGAQTISGTLTVVFDHNEGNAAHNMMPRIRVYVWKGDDTGVRGTLYSDANSATESDATDASLQTFFNAVTLTSVNALDGDRIVIECMVYNNNTKTVAYLHALNFDGAVGSNRESYIEFSQDLTFYAEVYEIYVDAVVKSSSPLATETTYNIEKDAAISSSGLMASESVFNILKDAIIKGDATPQLESIFNILKMTEIKVSAAYTVESLLNLYPDAVIYATAIPQVSIGIVKKTKIFLMIGNIAIQLSGD